MYWKKELKADVNSIDEVIPFFESEEGEKVLGKDTAAHLAVAAKEAKERGVKYCICPACTAGGWLLDHESEFWEAGTRSKTGLKIDRRDLRKPAGLERSDKPDTQTSDKIKKGIVKRLSNMFMESRFTISYYKKSGEECKSSAKGKHTARSSFLEAWRKKLYVIPDFRL